MSDLCVHEAHCQKLLGKPFTEVHNFLDQYHLPLTNPFNAHLHRRYLHHLGGIKRAELKFGSLGGQAAIIHVMEDCLGYVPNERDYEDGTVDEYGRPINPAKMNTLWFTELLR